MDVYCPRCGEPFDVNEFENSTQRRIFFAKGCGVALGEEQCPDTGSMRALASATMAECLGDDIDGIAAMLDDFDYLGMLDD